VLVQCRYQFAAAQAMSETPVIEAMLFDSLSQHDFMRGFSNDRCRS
jgi:hypothetical protein